MDKFMKIYSKKIKLFGFISLWQCECRGCGHNNYFLKRKAIFVCSNCTRLNPNADFSDFTYYK